MSDELPSRELRTLKARAQSLKPMLKVGKEGLSPAFLKSVDDAIAHHELIKVKFGEFKEEKKRLAPLLAEKTSAHLVTRVGNVAVLFRRKEAKPAG